jgi:ABC-type multidrug transport system fused ATPase/permease subunit
MFLKKPPIVVLDEATSSLDNKTEKSFSNLWKSLSKTERL